MEEPRLYINDKGELIKVLDGTQSGRNTFIDLTAIDKFFGGHKSEDLALADFARNHKVPDILEARRQIFASGESGLPLE